MVADGAPLLTRSLSASRLAYKTRDTAALARAHSTDFAASSLCRRRACDLSRIEGAPHVKNLVYGGLDGTLATFAIVSAVYGSGLPWTVCLVMGCASLLAEAISMGLGDYFSSSAESEQAANERAREEWEYDNNRQGEEEEMVQVLTARGVPKAEAEGVISVLAKHRGFFVDFMLTHELGILPPDESGGQAARGAAVTFVSFLLCGCTPIVVFCALQAAAQAAGGGAPGAAEAVRGLHFCACCVATSAATFLLGVCKAAVTGGGMLPGGLRMTLNAALAGAASFAVSRAMALLLGALGFSASGAAEPALEAG